MWLKNVKLLLGKKGSIVLRLTLFYSLTTFLLLTMIATFLYWGMESVLYKASHQFLSDKTATIKKVLQDKPFNRSILENELEEPIYDLDEPMYYYHIRILDDAGHLLLESADIEPLLRNTHFFQQILEEKKRYGEWRSPTGKSYLLIQAEAKSTISNNVFLIQMALDISSQVMVMSEYQKKLMMALLLGTFFAIVFGFVLAQRAMSSLRSLTETTKQITAYSLNKRIDPEFWPKELGMLGKAFNQMLNRIEDSFSRLNEFSADLAHELRTPVNNLMGQTEIVLSQKNCSSADYKYVLESNLEELQRLSQVIENILFLARTENQQADVPKKLIHTGDEIALICDYFQPIAEEKSITLNYQGNAELSANLIMFRRMISNLLSNALKYTPEGGQVSITVTAINKTVTIMVSDTGIGIANHHLSKLFDRFYRIDTARSHESGGTGLGLAIVKSIVTLHGGQISIRSELNQGTVVELTLQK